MINLDDLFETHAAEQLRQAEREEKQKAARFAAMPKEEQDRIRAEAEAKAAQLCDGIDVTRYNDDEDSENDNEELGE